MDFTESSRPRPGLEINSIDMVYGAHPRGVPVLIALTTATAAEREPRK